MHTPRPTIDVDGAFCSVIDAKRRKEFRSRIHTSHALRRVIREYRSIQLDLLREKFNCSKKGAKLRSEDPSPYEDGYIFYCLPSRRHGETLT